LAVPLEKPRAGKKFLVVSVLLIAEREPSSACSSAFLPSPQDMRRR